MVNFSDVSIRTRHRCRVMPDSAMDVMVPGCFNPHPASLPGDALPEVWL